MQKAANKQGNSEETIDLHLNKQCKTCNHYAHNPTQSKKTETRRKL